MKKIPTVLFISLIFLHAPSPVLANGEKIPSPITLGSIGELINKVSGLTTPLAVVGFIAMVIYAGLVRMTAAGNPDKEAKGMKIAVSAMIGFAIIALAPLVVKVLARLIGVQETIIS